MRRSCSRAAGDAAGMITQQRHLQGSISVGLTSERHLTPLQLAHFTTAKWLQGCQGSLLTAVGPGERTSVSGLRSKSTEFVWFELTRIMCLN